MKGPDPLGRHPAGERIDVRHACPAHPIGDVPPFCEWCLGSGLVGADKLARWVREQNDQVQAGRID